MTEFGENVLPLTDEQIVALGKKAANKVNAHSPEQLRKRECIGQLVLELSMDVHEMTHPDLAEVQRVVPEEDNDQA